MVFDSRDGLDHTVPLLFATAAFAHIGRWETKALSKAIQLSYSSLVRSQSHYPHLAILTDEPKCVPQTTTMRTRTRIDIVTADLAMITANSPYNSPWHALSRFKLDFVDALIKVNKKHVVWIDLDTLVFVDLAQSFKYTDSWVLGFHHGPCQGSGCRIVQVRPAFDVQGDLWSLTSKQINQIYDFEKELLNQKTKLPQYDLQGLLSLMLEDHRLSIPLLHRELEYSFGFACSDFHHPTVANLHFAVNALGQLICPLHEGVDMPQRVGSWSFTAPSFRELFLRSDGILNTIKDEKVQAWFRNWFFSKYTSTAYRHFERDGVSMTFSWDKLLDRSRRVEE